MNGNQLQHSAKFIQTIQTNCDISDARDNGIYSICTLILKLRNQYKWENNLAPWEEPDSANLLDWIEQKETFWETIAPKPYENFFLNQQTISHLDISTVNKKLSGSNLLYGSGFGRSLKSVFFLAEVLKEYHIHNYPVFILGREKARELSSPFAMLQEKKIFIRRDALRFYFWDQIQDINSSSRTSLYTGLNHYGIIKNNKLDQKILRNKLNTIVDNEIDMFIYHEVGELLQETLDSLTLKKIISSFPGSSIEFVSRALKDILADTHPEGMLQFILKEKRISSLAFYVSFLDGLRKVLFPEIINAFDRFQAEGDWSIIQNACSNCRQKSISLAHKIKEIAFLIDQKPGEVVRSRFAKEIIFPLGLDIPN